MQFRAQSLAPLLPQLGVLDWQLGGLGSNPDSTAHLLCKLDQVSTSLSLSFLVSKMGVITASHSYCEKDHRQVCFVNWAAIWEVISTMRWWDEESKTVG